MVERVQTFLISIDNSKNSFVSNVKFILILQSPSQKMLIQTVDSYIPYATFNTQLFLIDMYVFSPQLFFQNHEN